MLMFGMGSGGGIGNDGSEKEGILIGIPGIAGSVGSFKLMFGMGSGGGIGSDGILNRGILQLLMAPPPSSLKQLRQPLLAHKESS